MGHSYYIFRDSTLRIIKAFSPFERVLFAILFLLFFLSSLILLQRANAAFMIDTPASGGTLTEGIVGTPRFINPLLAISDADRDISTLVYSGLLRPAPNGAFIPDLAESYSISTDGLIYTFTLRENAVFHDGEAVTAEDVLFTIKHAQDPALKSPRRANWEGVTVEIVGEREIHFILSQPYAPFLENTTLGILPEHIWRNVDVSLFPFSQFNIEPIGSGPYKIKKVVRGNGGVSEIYELILFTDFTLSTPLLKKITLKLYQSEEKLLDAFIKGDIESMSGISPARLSAVSDLGVRIEHTTLPRIFAVFFNQDQNKIFAKQKIREALSLAIDRDRVVHEVLSGYGTILNGPFPKGVLPEKTASTTSASYNKDKSLTLLKAEGWTLNEESGMLENKDGDVLSFSLSTANTPELRLASELVVSMWRELGVNVTLKLFEQSDLSQNTIRPRTYEALLFGEIIGRELDLFAFWHSSQRNDPGLNVALYANITTDKLLEDARTISDRAIRLEKFEMFEKEILTDTPAVFLYAPDFIYILPPTISGINLSGVSAPHERFLNVYEWYTETEGIWNFLIKYLS